ncbi:MAG: PKD domain-containing protein [Candidatus Thermoplasmatota archaeon]
MPIKTILFSLFLILFFSFVNSQPPTPHPVCGYIYYGISNIPIDNASLIITNFQKNISINIETDENGFYIFNGTDIGENGDLINIFVYKNERWSGNKSIKLDFSYAFQDIDINLFPLWNNKPSRPIINGSSYGHPNVSYNFVINCEDNDNDFFQYLIDWDNDGIMDEFSSWTKTYVTNHLWNETGFYEIRIVVKDTSEEENETLFNMIIEKENIPPYANFTYLPEEIYEKEKIKFIDKSIDEDGFIVNYTWEFGDGNISYERNPEHVYEKSGEYNVTLIVMDNNGSTSNKKIQIEVKLNHPPNKPALLYPPNGATGISINPTLSWECSDVDGGALTYDVYFGTSSPPPKLATVTTTSYNPGTLSYSTTYYWRIVAKDGKEENSSDIWQFTTTAYTPPSANQPPTCSLNANVSHGYAPLYVNFIINASDTDGSIVSWELDVNNDGIAEYNGSVLPATKEYVYNSPGNYTARLKIIDDKGASSDVTITILVLNRPPSVRIISPKNGETVRKNFLVYGEGEDVDGNIFLVEIRVDGGEWKIANGTTKWNYSLELSKGEHIIEARSYDGVNYSEVFSIKIKVEDKKIPSFETVIVLITLLFLIWKNKYRKKLF